MVLLWPWALVGFAVVAAAAVWALFRPGRHLAVVGSLELWQRALDGTARSARKRSRRIDAAWLLLLAGALAGAFAAARPIYRAAAPARHVTIGIVPSAEFAGPGGIEQLRESVTAFLDRLGPDDKVQLILPAEVGGGDGAALWQTRQQVREKVSALVALPAAASELTLAPPAVRSQHSYYFAPGSWKAPQGPTISSVPVSAALPPVTIEVLGAEPIAPDKVQFFLAMRNQTDNQAIVRIQVRLLGEDGRLASAQALAPAQLKPHERWQTVFSLPPARGYAVTVQQGEEGIATPGCSAYLCRQLTPRAKVALVGQDEPAIRRFVQVHPGLELVRNLGEADLVIACSAQPSAGKPAIVFDPPQPPSGWDRAAPQANVSLGRADHADHPVLHDVDLSGVVIRQVQPWTPSEDASQLRLVTLGVQALMLLTPRSDTQPPRLDVAFSLGGEVSGAQVGNTNFVAMPAFVIFLAHAVEALVPQSHLQSSYAFRTPYQAGPMNAWKPIVSAQGMPASRGGAPWPGIYTDSKGSFQAISLEGLGNGTDKPVRVDIAALLLPAPTPDQSDRELWPILIILAMALWLAGWALRAR